MKRIIALLLAIALMSVLFVGCNSAEENTPTAETNVASTPVTSENGAEATIEAADATVDVTDETTTATEATQASTPATEPTIPATEPAKPTTPKDPEVDVEVDTPDTPAKDSQEIDFDALLNAAG